MSLSAFLFVYDYFLRSVLKIQVGDRVIAQSLLENVRNSSLSIENVTISIKIKDLTIPRNYIQFFFNIGSNFPPISF